MIGQYFPIFFVGPIIARYGKRISMMIDSILFLIGFILMGLSVNVVMLCIAKFFMGKKNLKNKFVYPYYFVLLMPTFIFSYILK